MIDAVKIPVAENTSAIQDLEKRFNLKTLDEFKYFALEICDMVDEGKKIDLGKAAHNAKYFAEINSRIKDIKSGKNLIAFTDED